MARRRSRRGIRRSRRVVARAHLGAGRAGGEAQRVRGARHLVAGGRRSLELCDPGRDDGVGCGGRHGAQCLQSSSKAEKRAVSVSVGESVNVFAEEALLPSGKREVRLDVARVESIHRGYLRLCTSHAIPAVFRMYIISAEMQRLTLSMPTIPHRCHCSPSSRYISTFATLPIRRSSPTPS